MEILKNYPLICALSAFLVTQAIKYPIAKILGRPADLSIIFSTGGMPSSHSAGILALIVALIYEYGLNSPLVAIAIVFGVIVMYDSMGVRRQSGEHGIILKTLSQEIQVLDQEGHGESSKKIKEVLQLMKRKNLLGHQPIEVLAGAVFGAIWAIFTIWLLEVTLS